MQKCVAGSGNILEPAPEGSGTGTVHSGSLLRLSHKLAPDGMGACASHTRTGATKAEAGTVHFRSLLRLSHKVAPDGVCACAEEQKSSA